MEPLQIVWFVLIAVLWTGYFVLEGFDFGVGILSRLIAEDDVERRMAINTIGPVWDGNEVWLLTAGGATFAAFPFWYATMFPAFYLALLLILVALIVRGVAFEYRHKVHDDKWRDIWDWGIFIGSLLPALLWGVAWGNIIAGLPIEDMAYTGNFFNLIDPYSLVAGVFGLALFIVHGALYLALKTTEPLAAKALGVAQKVGWGVVGLYVAVAAWSVAIVPLGGTPPWLIGVLMVLVLGLLGGSAFMAQQSKPVAAFSMTAGAILSLVVTIFAVLFPRVMVSSLGPEQDMTIAASAASNMTLTLMTIAAGLFVPVVLGYTGWTYYVFRHRVSRESITGPTATPMDVLSEKLGGNKPASGTNPTS